MHFYLMKNMKSSNSRGKQLFDLYKSGKTLADIGEIYGITRSRVQQIILKEVKKEILDDLNITYKLSAEEMLVLHEAAKNQIQEILSDKRADKFNNLSNQVKERINKKMKLLPNYSFFDSLAAYADALGEQSYILKKYYPEIVADISNRQKSKWSKYYQKCRSCGTTKTQHASYGLCKKCYFKSDLFKDIQDASRLRNKNKWIKKQREYAKKYAQRPEVQEKNRLNNDINNFGGNREKAITRDNYRCVSCGISRESSFESLKKDLFVKRINGDSNNNNLENLVTLCSKCFKGGNIKKMHDKLNTKLLK